MARSNVETVTILLGAGASLSSGAPTTDTVEEEIFAANEDNIGDRKELREKLHTISQPQVESIIEPLFENVHPHLGYLNLAALSRSVRVLIVNLNWDSAVEDACRMVGVDHQAASLALEDGVDEIRAHLENPDCRLVNLHLHGRLGHGKIRFGRRHTLGFDSGEEALVWNEFFSNPTIVVGASLRGEYDISRLLEEASQSADDDKAPFWLFSRQAERAEVPEDSEIADLLSRHNSRSNFAGDPYVDFDGLMVELLECSRDHPLRRVFEGSGLAPPRPDDLVLPAPKLLAGHLDGPSQKHVLTWIGERRVGKSTNARLIAHWAGLRSEHLGQVAAHSRKVDCAREAAKLLNPKGPPAPDFVIFDDPFGAGGKYEDSDNFVAALSQILDADDAPRAMITCCPSNWRRALADYPELGEWSEEILGSPTEWYRGLDLAANADDPGSRYPAMVTRRVLEGVASTPARVAAANAMRSAGDDDAVIAEKIALLKDLPLEDQEFLALVRFYELSSSVAPQSELIKRFQKAKSTKPAGDACHMLERFELDGDSFWRFAHYTDRAAFDFLYREKGRQLLSEVFKHVYGPVVTDSVCAVWLAIASARTGDFDRIKDLSDAAKLEWGPVLLEEVANSAESCSRLDEVLELLPKVEEHDFWSLREIVYEVVRLWPELHESKPAIHFLDKVLDGADRMGRYCVIESLLYFQDTTHSETWERDERLTELWEKVTAARWAIVKDVEAHGPELALIIDALAWYTPPLPRDRLNRWVEKLINAADGELRLKGAFALSSLYHPPGEDLFRRIGRRSPLDYVGHLDEDQVAEAAAMVEWHYVHQSRARALLPRRRLEPSNPAYLRRTEQESSMSPEQAVRVQEFVEQMAAYPPHAGWAVHLGINLYWTAGNFDSAFLGRCIESVRDGDDGLISAALTYAIPFGALDAMKDFFRRPTNQRALRERMRNGCPVPHSAEMVAVNVAPPRFNAGRDPYGVHRQLETPWRGALERMGKNPSSEPDFMSRVHAILRLAYEEGFLELTAASELERRNRAGDHEALEVERTQDLGVTDRGFSAWLKRQDDFTKLVVLTAIDIDLLP